MTTSRKSRVAKSAAKEKRQKSSALTSDLAKLSRPRLYDALGRERLFGRLDELRRHPVVWLAGPPGAGKTTLIASYLEARKYGGIWYQLDVGDSDISTFFLYLGESAKALAPRKSLLPLLTPEYLFELTGFAHRYFRELFSRLPKHGTLDTRQLPRNS
jgi:LuxR family transcriptional regulator, maltose regulon positive regulatory protein